MRDGTRSETPGERTLAELLAESQRLQASSGRLAAQLKELARRNAAIRRRAVVALGGNDLGPLETRPVASPPPPDPADRSRMRALPVRQPFVEPILSGRKGA